jgi:hypothetical protein
VAQSDGGKRVTEVYLSVLTSALNVVPAVVTTPKNVGGRTYYCLALIPLIFSSNSTPMHPLQLPVVTILRAATSTESQFDGIKVDETVEAEKAMRKGTAPSNISKVKSFHLPTNSDDSSLYQLSTAGKSSSHLSLSHPSKRYDPSQNLCTFRPTAIHPRSSSSPVPGSDNSFRTVTASS